MFFLRIAQQLWATRRPTLPAVQPASEALQRAAARTEESRRLDALAGVLFQTCLGGMLAGFALAYALTEATPTARGILAFASFIVGLLGINAGLALLRTDISQSEIVDQENELAARLKSVNSSLFYTILTVLFAAASEMIVSVVPGV